jgi:SAM-dependent methyltransferase
LPHVVDRWISEYWSLRESDVLDFGCGEGVSALGLALNYQPRSVVGVDIMPDPEHCPAVARAGLGLEALPPNLRCIGFHPAPCMTPGSVRHRLQLVGVRARRPAAARCDAGLVKQALRPTGLFLAQIAPLYYSSEGSHLLHRIPEPWGHLTTQLDVYYGRLCERCRTPASARRSGRRS